VPERAEAGYVVADGCRPGNIVGILDSTSGILGAGRRNLVGSGNEPAKTFLSAIGQTRVKQAGLTAGCRRSFDKFRGYDSDSAGQRHRIRPAS
jgi:hypothetical protein